MDSTMKHASDKMNIIQCLLRSVPEFAEIYKRHIDSYEEVVPYVLLGDTARLFIEACRNNNVDLINKLQNVLTGLIKEDNELLSFGFLENLDQSQGDYELVKSKLIPEFQEILKGIESKQ